MPRSIESMKRSRMWKAPRKQLATKAARKSAPSSVPSNSFTHSSIIDLTSSPPPQETSEFPGLKSTGRPVMRRVPLKKQLASKAARKSAPSITYERYYEISEPSSPSEDMPISHRLTKEESANINENIRETIAGVSEEYLRSAILKVCAQSANAAELLLPLISDSGLSVPGKKRKHSRDLCEHCGDIASYEDDGCCKFRKMEGYRREEAVNELEALDSFDRDGICDNCGEKASDEDDGCCKWRRMQSYKRDMLRDQLTYGF